LDELGWVEARSLARDWNPGFGQMYHFASTGEVSCKQDLLGEVDSCLADLARLKSEFSGDEIIVGEVARMKHFRHWIEERVNEVDESDHSV
jgi:hypothetical protein